MLVGEKTVFYLVSGVKNSRVYWVFLVSVKSRYSSVRLVAIAGSCGSGRVKVKARPSSFIMAM